MNYTNMLYAAIAGLLVASTNSHSMEKNPNETVYSKTLELSSRQENAQDAGSDVYSSEVNTPRPVFIEPMPKRNTRRVKDSLLVSDENIAQQRDARNTSGIQSTYITSDDIKAFNKSRITKKPKSSCLGCFK